MRVTFVTTSFPIHAKSASGPFILELVQHLSKHIQIQVIAPDNNSKSPVRTHNFKVTFFRYAFKKLQIVAHQPGGIPAQLKKNRAIYLLLPPFFIGLIINCIKALKETDVFHCNWAITGCVIGALCSIVKIPCITTIRGSDVHLLQDSLLHKLIMRLCILTNDKIIVVSNSLAHSLASSLSIENCKILVIPNGVSDIFSKIVKSPKIHEPARLLWIGNLTKNKNLEFVIHAITRIPSNDQPHLTVIGDGPERNRLLTLIKRLGLSKKIEFIGTCSHEKILDYFANSDVFIMSSIREGRSNALVEALAAGMVVVAPQIDSVTELIVENEPIILYKQNDKSDFVTKLLLVLHDSNLRARLIKYAKSNFRKLNINWNNTAQEYVSVYNSCT